MGKGDGHLQRIIQAPSDLEPDFVETDYPTAMETLILRHKRRSLGRSIHRWATNLTFADELVKYMGILQRRHLVMTITMHDPRLQADTRKWPVNEGDVLPQSNRPAIDTGTGRQTIQSTPKGDHRTWMLQAKETIGNFGDSFEYIDIKNRSLL